MENWIKQAYSCLKGYECRSLFKKKKIIYLKEYIAKTKKIKIGGISGINLGTDISGTLS